MERDESYFQYTLDDLHKNSARKDLIILHSLLVVVEVHVHINLQSDVKYMNEFQQIHVDTYLANFPNTVLIVI